MTQSKLVLLTATQIVTNRFAFEKHFFRYGATFDWIASRLDLRDSQKVDLIQNVQEIAEKIKAMHADPKSRHRELADLIRQDDIEMDRYKKLGIMQTTIFSKFQVVISKPVREHLNLKPKRKLTVIEKDKLFVLIPHASLKALRGIAIGANTDDYREKKDRF